MNDFYVLLNSEASKDVCVNNSSTCFTNMMPHDLRLEDNWQVALQSVCVETSFANNVPKEIRKTDKHFIFCNALKYPNRKVTIPENNYTTETMIQYLHEKCFMDVPRNIMSTKVVQHEQGSRLIITLKWGSLLINQDVCRWLNIDTTGREEHALTYIDWYLNMEPMDANERVKFFVFEANNIYNEAEIIFNLAIPTGLPKIIKVKLGEMKQSLSSSGHHQDLAIVQFKKPENYVCFYHEVMQKEYFPLNSTLLQALSITITDEDNDELNVISHQPTFVKLKFKKMISSAFILRLSSADSNNIYPDNTATNFRIQLPRLLSLHGPNWQVALSSIIYPSQISIVDYLSQQDLWMTFEHLNGGVWIFRHRINLSNHRIATYEDIQNTINANAPIVPAGGFVFRIAINRRTKIANYSSRRRMRITLSPTLASILGSSTLQFIANNNDDNVPIGVTDIKRCMPNSLSVYTDFTSPTVVGGKFSRLLKFIPILQDLQATDGSVLPSVTYESHHMDFVNLPTTELQSLQFEVKDGTGKPLIFTDNNAVTYINLLFQKKQ